MHATTGSQARRAVVIEDDPEIRALYRPVLERLGFETVMTTNGSDGVAAVAEFSPVVTFLDVSMGGMDGFATAARIREFSDTYVVMISAHSDEIDVVQGLAAGADDYIFKPFRPRELRARVEAMLRRPRQRVAAPASQTASVPEPAPVSVRVQVGEPDLWQATTPARANTAPSQLRSVPIPEPTHMVAAEANTVVLPRESTASTARLAAPEASPTPAAGVLRHGALTLDLAAARVSLGDQHVELDAAEVNLLASLMETGTRVRSTANLVLALRGESYVTTYFVNESDKRSVVENMDALRRSLGDTGPVPMWIEPVGTVGFRMTPA